MTTPIRLQRRRATPAYVDWLGNAYDPADVVYVGRPTDWGNPFKTAERFRQWFRGNVYAVHAAHWTLGYMADGETVKRAIDELGEHLDLDRFIMPEDAGSADDPDGFEDENTYQFLCRRFGMQRGHFLGDLLYEGQRLETQRRRLLGCLGDLRGKHLACWCGFEKPCHADVLLELANRKETHDGR